MDRREATECRGKWASGGNVWARQKREKTEGGAGWQWSRRKLTGSFQKRSVGEAGENCKGFQEGTIGEKEQHRQMTTNTRQAEKMKKRRR